MRESFGVLPNGEPVERFKISDEHLSLSILSYGATVQSIRLAGIPFSLCFGFETLDEYLSSTACVGAIVGRVANRIGGGCAEINGKLHHFDRNENDRHTLHGGAGHLGNKNWSLISQTPTSIRLRTQLPDGENGFPGTLTVTVEYVLRGSGILEIILEAETDAPTLCNLAPHPYFNLNGGGDARKQSLFVDATEITETDSEKIPTGRLLPVGDTAWDHRTGGRMSDTGASYDHNYCVGTKRRSLRPIARLAGLESGVSMQIAATEPGLQVYDGAGLKTPYAGIAIEPQCWPDAPNHDAFPSILLRPDETSRQVTQLTFARS